MRMYNFVCIYHTEDTRDINESNTVRMNKRMRTRKNHRPMRLWAGRGVVIVGLKTELLILRINLETITYNCKPPSATARNVVKTKPHFLEATRVHPSDDSGIEKLFSILRKKFAISLCICNYPVCRLINALLQLTDLFISKHKTHKSKA